MRRLKGERFNPYGEWIEGGPVWELLEDGEESRFDTEDTRFKAVCIEPLKGFDCIGEEDRMWLQSWMFPDEAVTFEPKTGALAP